MSVQAGGQEDETALLFTQFTNFSFKIILYTAYSRRVDIFPSCLVDGSTWANSAWSE